MLKHNTYFDGKVQSIGFERNGRRLTTPASPIDNQPRSK